MIQWKPVIYGAGAALAITYFLCSVALGNALAQDASQAEQSDPQPASAGSITADQARTAVLVQFPGATVRQVQLEDENGTVVYGVQLTDAAGKGQGVKVDANTAQVLQAQPDGPEGQQSGVEAGNGGSEN
jgi:uncharacterized iron-regulated membrane protein